MSMCLTASARARPGGSRRDRAWWRCSRPADFLVVTDLRRAVVQSPCHVYGVTTRTDSPMGDIYPALRERSMRESPTMKIGLYLVSLHDRPLSSALDQMVAWGIRDAEVAAGGFVPTPHCPTRELVTNSDSRQAWLEEFTSRGVRITALNCNGSPLHPDPRVGPVHQDDILESIRLAALIGVDR